ncbi:fructosamine kinase family protein [Georgenia faecalis]|uniref:fructosamine kinase family protein n=1 Tax=Georgenia faecalis TaxID=2483799 RepID=UPI000FD9861E|nr:fructosamine kinase family protein [Georgenia faecalis]
MRKRGRPAAIAAEVAGLRWLAAAHPGGGTAVARVTGHGTDWLETAHVDHAAPDTAAAEDFGRSLARTHAAGAPFLGCAPPGVVGDGVMGRAPLVLHADAATAPAAWGEFYAADRLLPYLEGAVGNGSVDAAGARAIERCAERVATGAFDAPQPGLVRTPAARLHGDLWGGNVLWTRRAGPADGATSAVEAVLIDPAAHGGHAESDLAQLTVFGSPYPDRVLAAYDEVSPLADGWRERTGLHQLHMILVHAALFGGGYGAHAVALARRYGG